MQRRFKMILVIVAASLSLLSVYSAATPFTIDGSTVYVNAGFVGIRTSTPITTLDVNGDAQFGSGATRSTFTATGLLKLTTSGIQWADGTTSTTATSGGSSGTTSSSTYVQLCGGNQTPSGGQNSQGAAATVTNSTASMSFSAGSWAEVSISLFHVADGTQYNVDLYVDNALPSWVGSNGLMTCQGSASSIFGSCTGVFPIPVTTGAHVFYLKIWRGGNPVTLQMSNPCSYYTVKEMRAS